jgi:AcrR family transcriptional regulator
MPRAGLDHDTIVDAAAAIADTEGLASVTIARLAAHFGVRSPSLYNHVAGLDAIRRELTLRGLRELHAALRAAENAGGTIGDPVLALALAYRAFATTRPGLYAAALVRAAPRDDAEAQAASAAIYDLVAAALAPYPLTGDALIHAIRGLRSLIHGFVVLEADGGFGIPLDLDESFRRSIGIYTAGLRNDERRVTGVGRLNE